MSPRRKAKELRPKDRFVAGPNATTHAELAASKGFQIALEAAIAEMTLRQPRPETLEAACRSHYELLGARRFIDILLNLAEPDLPPNIRQSDNLIWQLPPQQPQDP